MLARRINGGHRNSMRRDAFPRHPCGSPYPLPGSGHSVTDDARHRETFGCELKSGTTRLPRSRRADKSGYGKRKERRQRWWRRRRRRSDGCSAEQPDQGGGGSSGWLLISRASLAPRLAAECPTASGRPEGLAVPATKTVLASPRAGQLGEMSLDAKESHR
ncbi:hypothetical protein DBV15_08041 [Temnothorax longispinosus]|uniref:Uncharacterized protein n=1 Tax=Temnothorax longispinosus TaxID=300112 RepID=A0A4S2KLN0_9HYME|nr:hypothetical protein DBV15_08041 [Temnothorax longispinosus]